MARKPLIAGNWKMNMNHLEAIALVQKIAYSLNAKDTDAVEVAVMPPFTDIRSVQTLIDADNYAIAFGGQDCSEHEAGAYTGEVSAAMLAKLGCTYVIVGHSERRQYHGETNADVNVKAKRVLLHNMTPIVCVGEGLDIREIGNQVTYNVNELRESLAGISADEAKSLVIAYEPVWAIGTGLNATPEQAGEVHDYLRGLLAGLYTESVAAGVRIQYGGSVKPDNVGRLMAVENVDGALVGGASLTPEKFLPIIEFDR